ncbi:hypothetical protein BCR42DRAFT_414348 [Absidia repens]|uniref:Methyltransferase domain-containing protein n=1 Tax=Absidia repens TaxID=90262 RepID=A0A1X2IJ34_9FUNG|nr:hypothetical protein BCR42DRAFT_414348 [Absidia repens]
MNPHPFLDQTTLQLYRDYVGIQTLTDLETHLKTIQRILKKTETSYRCIDQYKFATSRMNRRFFYSQVLKYKSQRDPFLIDIGCCTGNSFTVCDKTAHRLTQWLYFSFELGTDLRQLYLDGYPKEYLVGLDSSSHYIECGYELFKDRQHCPITFLVGDIFTETDTRNDRCGVNTYDGQTAVVMAGSVIHLFQDISQVDRFIARMAKLLRPGGLFVGAHVAMLHSGCVDRLQLNQDTDDDEDDADQQQWTKKFYLGQHEFKSLLSQHGFGDIQMESELRIPLLDQEQYLPASSTNQLFWLSFSATYSP